MSAVLLPVATVILFPTSFDISLLTYRLCVLGLIFKLLAKLAWLWAPLLATPFFLPFALPQFLLKALSLIYLENRVFYLLGSAGNSPFPHFFPGLLNLSFQPFPSPPSGTFVSLGDCLPFA